MTQKVVFITQADFLILSLNFCPLFLDDKKE